MIQLNLFRRIYATLADKEPGYKTVIRRTVTRMTKAAVENDGTKVCWIHKLGTYNGHGEWYWTKYRLEDDGKTATEVASGMYPSFFSGASKPKTTRAAAAKAGK